jgi:hypothetical protein
VTGLQEVAARAHAQEKALERRSAFRSLFEMFENGNNLGINSLSFCLAFTNEVSALAA